MTHCRKRELHKPSACLKKALGAARQLLFSWQDHEEDLNQDHEEADDSWLWEEDNRQEVGEKYRTFMWQNLAQDRPQHYDGTQDGVNRVSTCLWLEQLRAEADILQWQCDHNEVVAPEPLEDPRVKT